jgi:hypothetical protein
MMMMMIIFQNLLEKVRQRKILCRLHSTKLTRACYYDSVIPQGLPQEMRLIVVLMAQKIKQALLI